MGASYKYSRETPLMGGAKNDISVAGVVQYIPLQGVSAITGVFNSEALCAEFNGIISNMTSVLLVAPGAGATRTFTLYVNGAPTALTVTHGAADLVQFDDVNIVAVQRGDYMAWHSDGGVAGPALTLVKLSCIYRRI